MHHVKEPTCITFFVKEVSAIAFYQQAPPCLASPSMLPLGDNSSIESPLYSMSLYNSSLFSNPKQIRHRATGAQGTFKSVPSPPSWFDIRVVYVRVSSCPLDDESTPESLQFHFPSRSITSELEVNGARISPSEELFLTLRRDRIDCDSAEATYVSTDNVRCNSTVEFEVVDGDGRILSGHLVRTEYSICTAGEPTSSFHEGESYRDADSRFRDVEEIQESCSSTQPQSIKLGWSLECACAIEPENGCVFLKSKGQDFSTSLLHPTIEVCIVGRFNGLPVILTQITSLTMKRRANWCISLDSIPEIDEKSSSVSDQLDIQSELVKARETVIRQNSFSEKADAIFGGLYGNAAAYGEGEDGEMSWFNAGVRVGVGLGLGMCLGLGIGVGLMLRTYQVTARSFRRSFF